jgi:hypothetical protein
MSAAHALGVPFDETWGWRTWTRICQLNSMPKPVRRQAATPKTKSAARES